MEHNLFLLRFSKYKKLELDSSPAIDVLKTGGIVLADEVGLGKTIEAALVLCMTCPLNLALK